MFGLNFFNLKYILIAFPLLMLFLLLDMSMNCHCLNACSQYSVTLLAMNKTFFCP